MTRKLTRQVATYVSAEEYAAIKQASQASNRTVANFVRLKLLADLSVVPPAEPTESMLEWMKDFTITNGRPPTVKEWDAQCVTKELLS